MSDHTAKRQRLTGSFSPASPPYHLAKPSEQTQTKPPVVHPHTPTSPPYVPMSSQSNGGSGMTATAPLSEMASPSSVTMSQQLSQSAAAATNPPPFPTPASMTGVVYPSNFDGDGDAQMTEGHDGANLSGKHRPSNHERQSGDFELIGRDVRGESLFRLCQSTHPKSRPHGSQNLFDLYGLNDIAQSVARTDPKSGEKINKLRKSYEGHIKALQIAGKPKAVKMEGKLTEPLLFPDQEFQVQKVNGKEYSTAIDDEGGLTADFDALLNSAFSGMAPGPLPPAEAQKYRAYLGTEEAVKPKVGPDGVPGRATQPASAAPNASNQSLSSRASRPERTGSKRSYTDVSFQGYGEGYNDDFPAESTGAEDDGQGGMSKKRRLGFERTSHQVEVGGARR